MENQEFAFRAASSIFSQPIVGPFRIKRPPESTKASLPLERFPHPPRSDFICKTCSGVVRDPKECVGCGALLCGRCWEEASPRRQPGYYFLYRGREVTCPCCNETGVAREPSPILRRLILALQIRCKHYKSGCSVVVTIADLKIHQKSCVFRTIQCDNRLCCGKSGLIDAFIKLNLGKPQTTAMTVYACSELCKKTLLFDSLIRDNELEKAVTEFHILSKTLRDDEK